MTGSDSTDMEPNPIQWLCPDILSEIFTFCLPDVPKEPGKVEHVSTWNAPLLLCSVCSSWRSLAIATPRLWQALHFYYGIFSTFSTETESITSDIRTWLDRSRPLPLSIRASFSAEDPKSEQATQCRLILETLSQEISRWESFEINAKRIWVNPPRLHFGSVPMLHTFDISGSSIDGILFTAAPRLKRLRLHSYCHNPISVSGIPWDRLVELTIVESQTLSMVLQFIQCCSRLESLSLSIKEGDEDGSLSFRPTTQHNTLRRLLLRSYINAITDCLTLPALTALDLRSAEYAFYGSQLVDFFTRSNCELQELTLDHRVFMPDELPECLSHQSCQTLTRLVISQDNPILVDSELYIRLTYSDVDDDVLPICPKLGHLEAWHSYWAYKSGPGLLGRMVHSRCFGRAQDAQLRTLILSWSSYRAISKEDDEWLHIATTKGGLNIRTANSLNSWRSR